MTRRPPPPPWKRPSRIAWLVLALAGSCWLILHMPVDPRHMKARPTPTEEISDAADDDAPRSTSLPGVVTPARAAPGASSATPAATGTPKDGKPAPRMHQSPGIFVGSAAAAVPEVDTPTQRMQQRSDASVEASGAGGNVSSAAGASVTSAPGASEDGKPAPRMQRRSDAEKVFMRLKTFGRLFAIVGLAAFLGGLVEARRWHMVLAKQMGRLTRMARLPEISGLALPTALCSNAAANSILAGSHAKGEIRTSALIAGGIANSYLAYVSHALRVMYPVIAAVGLPGVLFFGVQFTGAFCMLLAVLLLNRWYVSGRGDTPFAEGTPGPDADPLAWPQAISRSAVRSLSLLFRMAYLTVPLILGIEWLLKSGALDFWEDALPKSVAALFPVELLSVVAAQMGGLVQSSALAAHLRADGLISNTQILLAMLVGSAVGNPLRMFRRNLPSALGIFPAPIAFTIVLGTQFSRFLATLLATTCVVVVMLSMR